MADRNLREPEWKDDNTSAAEEAQEALVQQTAPIIIAVAILTAVFSGVGVIYAQEQLSTMTFMMGIGLGALVALLVSTAWIWLIRMAVHAQTGLGRLVLIIAFLLTLAATLGMSTPTNLVFFLDGPARSAEREMLSQEITLLTERAATIGTQIDLVDRTLGENQAFFEGLESREIAGVNSRDGRPGPISNHYASAALLFTAPLASTEAARSEFEILYRQADSQTGQLIEAVRDPTVDQAAYASQVRALRSTARQMIALDPRSLARSAASRIRANIQPPVGVPAYGRSLVEETQERLDSIADELDQIAEEFDEVELPEMVQMSPVERVFAAAPRYPQFVVMAVAVDLFPLLIFLFRLPAMLAVNEMLRKQRERERKRKSAGLPRGDTTIGDIARIIIDASAIRSLVETLNRQKAGKTGEPIDLLRELLKPFTDEDSKEDTSDDDKDEGDR